LIFASPHVHKYRPFLHPPNPPNSQESVYLILAGVLRIVKY
jgi:hypothetical protein